MVAPEQLPDDEYTFKEIFTIYLYVKEIMQGSAAACMSLSNHHSLTLKLNWMSKFVPRQTIHQTFRNLFMHLGGFKFYDYTRLSQGCRALKL